MGQLYLQVMGDGPWKIVAKINANHLKKDSYCADDVKYGFGSGYFHLVYLWRVNLIGSGGLQVFSPKTKKTYYGWPDGIESNPEILP